MRGVVPRLSPVVQPSRRMHTRLRRGYRVAQTTMSMCNVCGLGCMGFGLDTGRIGTEAAPPLGEGSGVEGRAEGVSAWEDK